MRLCHFAEPAGFRKRTHQFLMADEAGHNLMLGISGQMVIDPFTQQQQPYLALVEGEAGEPVVAALRTPPHNLVLSRVGDHAALSLLVDDIVARMPDCPGVIGMVPDAERFAILWRKRTGHAYHLNRAERIYQLEQVRPVDGVTGRCRRATLDDLELILDWVVDFQRESGAGGPRPAATAAEAVAALRPGVEARLTGQAGAFFLWEVDRPVSMAGYARSTPNGICIGPVYTPPEFRRHGYASALTAAISQQVLETGRRYCFLFADLANATANHIYQAIGFQPAGDVDEIAFEP